jgi:hypothetical protein
MRKTLWISLVVGTLFVSCGKSPSLQSYYVEKMDDASFFIINLPIQLDSLFANNLTAKEQSALESIDKLNLLFHRSKEGQEEKYKNELSKVTTILAQDKYQHLMDFKAFDKAQGSIMFEGSSDQIEEGIVFVNSTKMGFGVLRIIGSDMEPAVIMTLVKKVNPDQMKKQLGSTAEILKGIFD